MNKSLKTLLTMGGIAACIAVVACGDDDNATGKDSGGSDSSSGGLDSGSSSGDSGSKDSGGDGAVVLPTGQIDRMGRPAINTALSVVPGNAATTGTDKDAYNHSETYAAATLTDATATTNFNTNINGLNCLSGQPALGGLGQTCPATGTNPLTGALLLDVLIVDTSKGYDPVTGASTYLDVEAYVLGLTGGVPNTTCGGRVPNDDTIDVTLSLLVGGPTQFGACRTALNAGTSPRGAACIADQVDAPAHAADMTAEIGFPYLAAAQ